MEKPLDLSNREDETEPNSDSSRDAMEDFPSRDDPICQVENCDCPLKHIIQLDSQNKSSKKNGGGAEEHNETDAMQYPFYNHFISSHTKRPHVPPQVTPQFINLKRRRVNMYNNETGQCAVGNASATASALDNSATSAENGNNHYDQSSSPFYRTYIRQTMNCANQRNKQNDTNGFHDQEPISNARTPSIISYANGPINGVQNKVIPEDIGPFQRERSKSVTNRNMLPKKRGIKRYSPDPELGRDTPVGNDSTDRKYIPRQTSSPVKPRSDYLLPLAATRSSPSPTTSPSPQPSETMAPPPPKYDAKSIKADMIREIESQKDDEEDVQTFRRKLFESFMKTKEQIKMEEENKALVVVEEKKKENEVVHANPMTSLDYLISKTLMESEDKPFKARNNHIHEIIRGEKRGRLCLMDLVELQVEMGLA